MKLLIVFLMLSLQLPASIVMVKPGTKIPSIKLGVAMAKEGDTVFVAKGNYNETQIEVTKSLFIKGLNRPTLNGQNKTESIFYVSASNVYIQGFRFTNIGISYTKEVAAIFASGCSNFTFNDHLFEDVFYAFIIQEGKYGLLKANKITGHGINEASSGNGIHVWKSAHMRIEQNSITGMRDGIYLEFIKKSHISNNTCENNIRYGLHFMFSNENEYHHNEFKNNGAGVAVMFSKQIKMHHNTFHFNWGAASYGLLLKEINDAEINDNIFEQNTIGVNIDGCNRVTYKNNQFIRNGWALRFTGGCYTNTFQYNNFMYNTFDLSYNSKVNDNIFEANYWSEYTGYDLDKNGVGDVPYRPVKLFSYIVNKTPEALILLRTLFVDIINFSEKVSPVFTPDKLVDVSPLMKPIKF